VPLTLAGVGAVHLVTAAAFFAVGARFRSRDVGPGMSLARNAFVVWWWCFGAYLALQGLVDLAAAAGQAPLGPLLAMRLLSGPLIAAAAWGLAYHILFLWSGRPGWALPLAFYYGAAGAVYSCWLWFHGPEGVEVGRWTADVTYADPIAGPVWNAVLASVGLPLVLGSLAFLALAFKVKDREQRYRIVLVGSSLLVWVVSGYAAQVAANDAMRFATIVGLGLATALAVLAAYYPPAPVRRWLHPLPAAAPATA
jgi:hypothetical protein